jgi:hypothetical protein
MTVNSKKLYRLSEIDLLIRATSSLTSFAITMMVLSLLLFVAIHLLSNQYQKVEARAEHSSPAIENQTPPTAPLATRSLEGPIVFRQANQLAVYYSCNGRPYSRSFSDISKFTINCDTERFYPVYAQASKPVSRITTDKPVTIISHINGDTVKLISLLKMLGVIDAKEEWSFGDKQLVFLGNIVNAHASNYDLLWKIYQLEYAAKKSGGDIHFIHGLQEQYLLESSNRNHIPVSTEIASTPFAYTFDADTVLGQWLRSKNTMMIINNHLLSYAQASKELLSLNMSIEHINESLYEYWQHQYITSTLDFILNENGPTKHIASESDFKSARVANQMSKLGVASWISSQGRAPMRAHPEYSVTVLKQHQNSSLPNYSDVIRLDHDRISFEQLNHQTID